MAESIKNFFRKSLFFIFLDSKKSGIKSKVQKYSFLSWDIKVIKTSRQWYMLDTNASSIYTKRRIVKIWRVKSIFVGAINKIWKWFTNCNMSQLLLIINSICIDKKSYKICVELVLNWSYKSSQKLYLDRKYPRIAFIIKKRRHTSSISCKNVFFLN